MAEISLRAALRDVDARTPEARNLAVRNLAPALLAELQLQPPVTWRAAEHPQREAVVAALERASTESAPQNAALAVIGLAQISAPTALDLARAHLEAPGDDDAAMFTRECGVIALSLIGAAARDAELAAEREVLPAIEASLRGALKAEYPDLRYQAAPALIEILGEAAEAEIVAAFAGESHERVRANFVAALSMLDPPGPAACDVLAELLSGPEGGGEVGWEAAMALTAAGRHEGAHRLIAALRSRETRDRALEALAVIGPAGPPETREAVARYTRGFLVPVFTRVRAAYALARLDPPAGLALLERLSKHPRPAVREAVAEAREHLATLG